MAVVDKASEPDAEDGESNVSEVRPEGRTSSGLEILLIL